MLQDRLKCFKFKYLSGLTLFEYALYFSASVGAFVLAAILVRNSGEGEGDGVGKLDDSATSSGSEEDCMKRGTSNVDIGSVQHY